MTILLPDPIVRPDQPPAVDVAALQRALEQRVDGEVRFDAGSRAAYSTDASNYRQVPIGVVVPHTVEAAVEAVAVCREHGAPLLSRGGGTSLAGECTNTAVVIDWSKYCDRLLSVDAPNRTCEVEPGIVLDLLNRQLSEHDLRFGPEPATHSHCTLGGMIGNNSCGATAQRAGKVVDNVVALEVLLYDGTRRWVGPLSDDEYAAQVAEGGSWAQVLRQLRELRDTYLGDIRTRYPDIPRRVSGYNLDSLLPEKGFDLAGLLVGSESTLVTVLRARLTLIPVLSHRSLVVLGYPSIDKAADAVPRILRHAAPIALEGLDDKLVAFERKKHMNPEALTYLPAGSGFLMVQFGADSKDDVDAQAKDMLDALHHTEDEPSVSFFDDPDCEQELWLVRESGLGATARVPGQADEWPGWEDSAVPVDKLGDYLRDLRELLKEFDYDETSLYGHFGQACVHGRIPFDVTSADGIATMRRFLERAAHLVADYGGSLSGEHGDGQARGELLPIMFGERIVTAFGQLKAIFDPGDRMNPGKVAAPLPLDSQLRLGSHWSPQEPSNLHFAYPDDDGSFSRAVLRCVGVGKCRQHTSEGSVMCPSYMVTKEEEHSTRGRSRLLFEMLNGHGDSPVEKGMRDDAVKDALDLCLACKGCKNDCPVNVDMATYKAEFLSHYYEGRQWKRQRSDLSMGWLPVFAAVVTGLRAGPVVNALTAAPGLRRAALAVAGVDRRRDVPLFAGQNLQQWWAARGGSHGAGTRGRVVLWPDSFNNHFSPHVGKAAVEVLEEVGYEVVIPDERVCCGLTWISTGQLATAKRVLERTVRVLAPYVQDGTRIVGLEPSCTAVLRSDAAELFPADHDVRRLQRQTVTLAELLHEHTPDWTPPQLEAHALIQTHCHQHAIMGFEADKALLKDVGVDPEPLPSGCCGLAGNFGFQPGHHEVSIGSAERVLLPRLRESSPDELVMADGFSCRTQIEQNDAGGRRGVHLSEVLLGAQRGTPLPAGVPMEQALAVRPSEPGWLAKTAALAGVFGAGVLGVAGVAAAVGARRSAGGPNHV